MVAADSFPATGGLLPRPPAFFACAAATRRVANTPAVPLPPAIIDAAVALGSNLPAAGDCGARACGLRRRAIHYS